MIILLIHIGIDNKFYEGNIIETIEFMKSAFQLIAFVETNES